jgi:cysteine desulfurase / selenocysteine lyase
MALAWWSTAHRLFPACRLMCKLSTATFMYSPGTRFFGPTGIGVVYGKLDVLDAMPPWQGGGNMIADVTVEDIDALVAALLRLQAGRGRR